jgi:hypothetical protein
LKLFSFSAWKISPQALLAFKVSDWLSEALAHPPTAVSLLLLESLFMQISGVSLTLT